MSVLFFIPLTIIAVYESQFAHPKTRQRLQLLETDMGIEEEDDPKVEDPSCDEEGEISRVAFQDLVKRFPKYVKARFHRDIATLSSFLYLFLSEASLPSPSKGRRRKSETLTSSTCKTESAVIHDEIKSLRQKIDGLERVIRESTPMREEAGREKKGKQ